MLRPLTKKASHIEKPVPWEKRLWLEKTPNSTNAIVFLSRFCALGAIQIIRACLRKEGRLSHGHQMHLRGKSTGHIYFWSNFFPFFVRYRECNLSLDIFWSIKCYSERQQSFLNIFLTSHSAFFGFQFHLLVLAILLLVFFYS